jgi:hypothetical protein
MRVEQYQTEPRPRANLTEEVRDHNVQKLKHLDWFTIRLGNHIAGTFEAWATLLIRGQSIDFAGLFHNRTCEIIE